MNLLVEIVVTCAIVQSHVYIVHNGTILTDVHVEGEMALALSAPAPLD